MNFNEFKQFGKRLLPERINVSPKFRILIAVWGVTFVIACISYYGLPSSVRFWESQSTQTEQVERVEQVVGELSHQQFAEITQIATDIELARKRLNELDSKVEEWKSKREKILTGNQGRRLATSEAHIELCRKLLAITPPSQQILEEWKTLLATFHSSAEDLLPQLSDDKGQKVSRLANQIADCHSDSMEFETLYARLNGDADRLALGERTMQEAFDAPTTSLTSATPEILRPKLDSEDYLFTASLSDSDRKLVAEKRRRQKEEAHRRVRQYLRQRQDEQ